MKIYRGKKSFSSLFNDLSKAVFNKYGFANQKIAAHWPLIVGENIAKYTLPQKIIFKPAQTRGGVLHIGVSNPGLSLELQANEGRIIEKISTFFGYQAVSRIKVNIDRGAANSNKPQPKSAPKIPLSQKEATDISQQLNKIKDPELKKSLSALFDTMFKS